MCARSSPPLGFDPGSRRSLIAEQFRDAPDMIRESCGHGWCTRTPEMGCLTQLVVWDAEVIGVSISNPAFCTLSNMGGLTDLLIWLHKRIEEKGGEVGRVHPLAQSFLLAFHHGCSSDSPDQFICLAYTFYVSIC